MSDSYDDYDVKCQMMAAAAEDFEKFWTTKDGERIRYQDMTQSHLENAFNMLERHRKKEGLYPLQWVAFEALQKEIERRKCC